ncbi:MAG: aminotransferase class I/II-fold pyridoxal phosphate-dependent enzyme [Alphaproteobacteria bacterium]|nr:aminotransferase class I/II-fold pyridoxal phosphate-dependent enzyme [Alphaproteobacteria bacterium]
MSVLDFFNVATNRMDGWNALNNAAVKLSHAKASGREDTDLEEQVKALLERREVFESFWAYPGLALYKEVVDLFKEGDYTGFAQAVDRITRGLMSGAYRRGPAAWNLTEEIQDEGSRVPDYYERRDVSRPYFEVLIVDDNVNLQQQQRVRDELKALRRPEDPFIYEAVFVPSFEDAVAGVLMNHNAQSVVIYDYFPFESRYDMQDLRERIERFVEHDPDTLAPESYGTALADGIHKIRPELDIFLMTDRRVEEIAGQATAAHIRRVFYDVEELNELHLSILDGVSDRYKTPHFSNLEKFSRRPIGTFHALPIARGKSIFKSHWIKDMGHFYGTNLFLAETSTTAGGLDSLLEPKGNIKEAHALTARAFGSEHSFFVTNGTSTANKIVVQALCKPGDIVIVDRNCHKSHHYGFVVAGAQPYYVEAYPMIEYSMYGGVPLRTIKKALFQLQAEGKLDKVKMVLLTNCTFDGHIYNVKRFMEECLAIKPDLVFLWDEAWYAFARFSPLYRGRTAMGAVPWLHERYSSPEYRDEYEAFKKKVGKIDPKNEKLLDMHLLPDPDKVRIRAYSTHSTHKSLSALRQGSMIHVHDEDYEALVHEPFEEAFMTHTSTSPNAQIIASLDLSRRQVELEGYELVREQIALALTLRNEVNNNPLISKYFRILTPAEMVPDEYRGTGVKDYGDLSTSWSDVVDAWEEDEFVLDPTRLTLVCGTAGYDGTSFKTELMDKYDIQLNKTSRNSVLFQSNINNTRSATSYVISTLAQIAADLDKQLEGDTGAAKGFQARVKSLMEDVPDLPNFSRFHDAFRDDPKGKTLEGHMRDGYFEAYVPEDCDHLAINSKEMDDRLEKGPEVVSANFVIPYPPGFPIMVPGQVVTREIIDFMLKLDVKEIHGYNKDAGLKIIKPEVLKNIKRPQAA